MKLRSGGGICSLTDHIVSFIRKHLKMALFILWDGNKGVIVFEVLEH